MKILKRFAQLIIVVIAVSLIYLLIIAVIPGMEAPPQPLPRITHPDFSLDNDKPFLRKNVSFPSQGIPIDAWLYLPEKKFPAAPCIVMAHGLGGIKEMGLDYYARRFQEAGFAVLAFDYRYWGKSGGEPRHLIWIPDQLEDCRAAVRFVRGLKEINPAGIALWGTSLSGGHVLVIAAEDKKIAAVAAQCPGVDGRESAEMAFFLNPLSQSLRQVMHGQRDIVRSWLGLSPHKVPIVGKPGTVALMTVGKAFEAFDKLAPANFVNEAPARIIVRADKYRPIQYASAIRCPVLLQICLKDEIVPVESLEETAKILSKYGKIKKYPIGHFAIYAGQNRENALQDQIEFFRQNLPETN